MKLIPVLTEKSMKLAKESGYTFLLPMALTKTEIRNIVEKSFGVHVTNVRTLSLKGGSKKNARGHVQRIKASKKAVVFLRTNEKIDLFEEEKKAKKVKKGTKASK